MVVRPDVEGIGVLDIVDVHNVIRLGEQAMDAVLPDLRQAVSWPNRLRRRIIPHKKFELLEKNDA